MNSDQVKIERDGEVATVTINRPARRNALGSSDAQAVASAIVDASQGSRVIILTGAGEAFCAGGDLEELERWNNLEESEISGRLYESFQQMVRNIRASHAVVIAAINGAAVGAGMDLALACDLRIASSSAKLGQIWVRLGVIPGTGGAWLTQMVAGPTRAAEMLLTGDLIDAETALAAGLVNEVVTAEDLLPAARRMANRILRHPRDGVVANKLAMTRVQEAALEAALLHAAEVQPERFTSEEFRKAVRGARSPRA